MLTIPELITQWREKKISGLTLLRGVVSHDQWQVRVSDAAMAKALAENTLPTLQIVADPAGKLSLLAFSSSEAYDRFAKASGITGEQHFLTMKGTNLFSGPLAEVECVQIDALSSYDIIYETNLFERLRETARAVEVEQALAALRKGEGGPGAFATARDYKNYYVAVVQKDGHPVVLNAPDDQERRLAAVFTADDAFDAFVPQAKAVIGETQIQQLQMDGVGLFDTLQRISVDGFVFNCSGPTTPVAFAKAAAQVIMEG